MTISIGKFSIRIYIRLVNSIEVIILKLIEKPPRVSRSHHHVLACPVGKLVLTGAANGLRQATFVRENAEIVSFRIYWKAKLRNAENVTHPNF